MPQKKIDSLPGYMEIVEDIPITYTVSVAAAQPFKNLATKWLTSYLIRVRSMGTATYIRCGNQIAQEFSLTAVGATKSFACNPGEVVDGTQIYLKSDTADAVVEIICSYPPVRLQSNVVIADGDT